MKRLFLIFVTIIATSCSFDNKTGIWKDASNIPVDKQDTNSIENNNSKNQYEDIFIKNKIFNEEKESFNTSGFEIDAPVKIANWLQQFAISTNNISNFSYSGKKKLLYKSSKLSRFSSTKNYSNRNIIFYEDNLITYDHKGTIFIYSLSLNKKIFKYNFYKKNFKKFEKKIYLIIKEDTLYAADNLGYLYAINLNSKLLIWAKNYGIPFRSNLKIVNEQIFLANQDNVIYSININTGDKNWQFSSTITFLKSDFENSIALDEVSNSLYFLNTSGELYSINYLTQKINWVLNFKNPSTAGDTNLFLSQPVVIKNNNLIITTEKAILSYDIISASRNWIFASGSILKPVVTTNYTYIVTKNDLFICLENKTGEVIWSKNIYKNLQNKKIKKIGKFYDFKIANKKLNLFSKNGYLLSFNHSNGNLDYLKKISKKGINSKIIFIKDNMFLIDNNNKLLKYN